MSQSYTRKIGWGKAVWTYFTDKNEFPRFIKYATGAELLSFLDELGDFIPGIDAITIGDDFIVPVIFAIFSFFRIIHIRFTRELGSI